MPDLQVISDHLEAVSPHYRARMEAERAAEDDARAEDDANHVDTVAALTPEQRASVAAYAASLTAPKDNAPTVDPVTHAAPLTPDQAASQGVA